MSSPFPPQPQVNAPRPVGVLAEPRVIEAGRGAEWWGAGWRMFTSQIGTWIGVVLVYFVISIALSKVPYIGSVAQWLLTPVFAGGIMLGCAAIDRGERLRFSHIFDGFKGQHFTSLLIIGVFNIVLALVAVILAVVVVAAAVGLSGLANIGQLAADPWEMLLGLGLVTVLTIMLALLIPVAVYCMVNWFAPALVVLQDLGPAAAMMRSFRACLRNWAPFLVYGAIGVAILIVGVCLFGVLVGTIGFSAIMAVVAGSADWKSIIFGVVLIAVAYVAFVVVMFPVIVGSTYAGYRDTLAPAGKS